MSDTNTPAGRAGLAYDWLAPKLSTTERQELDVIVRDLTAAQEQIAALTAERERLTKELASERTARKEADEHAIDLRNEIIRLDAALAAPPSPLLPGLERDAEMLDWLSRQYVAVRIPLRYGSRECFIGSPDLEEETWDLRAAIRAEISRLKGEGRGS